MAKLNVVGIGPGSLDYVTPAARKAVRSAAVVIGAERSLRLFRKDIKGEAVALTAQNVTALLNYAAESAEKGKTVALLSTGDPGFSGLLRPILEIVKGRDVDLTVIPAVSSIQACAARLRMCWDEMSLFSFHKGATAEKKAQLAKAVKEGKDIMLLPDPKVFSLREIAHFLVEAGLAKETPVFVCERLTLSDERVLESTLAQVFNLDCDTLSVLFIKLNQRQKR
ncbi:MAG: precorrin-6y C5,15-methyltransferase (decarboxylating) subunit CbiE [Candidatus Bathyarchaeota archaeon]|nr:precorrin-6y C5,15-methyltransferase (decarboxylating) subunit CbiE [Candidatus Bathyarchaeota archaeon]